MLHSKRFEWPSMAVFLVRRCIATPRNRRPDPEPDHTSEIIILGLPAKKGMISIVYLNFEPVVKAGDWQFKSIDTQERKEETCGYVSAAG